MPGSATLAEVPKICLSACPSANPHSRDLYKLNNEPTLTLLCAGKQAVTALLQAARLSHVCLLKRTWTHRGLHLRPKQSEFVICLKSKAWTHGPGQWQLPHS